MARLAPESKTWNDLGRTREDAGRPLALEVRDVSQSFTSPDGSLSVLENVDLEVRGGELVSIIGPSGCGKSTLFNILAGLQEPTAGEVWLDGRPAPARLGRVGYMPQKDLLLPWKTVLDNTIIPLELLGVPRREAREEATRWFGRFGLEGFESYRPAALSGGMRQRAALLRTFLSRRDALLLDEPFGALDAITRADLQEWLLDVWSSSGKTLLLVTHDVDEALFLSDRVYVMTPRPGRVARILDVPLERPRAYENTVTSSVFARLKREILASLRPGRQP